MKFAAVFTVLACLLAGCQNLPKQDWSLIKERDGVAFYLRPVANSSVPEFKGVTTARASISQLLTVLLDVDSYPQWVYQCRQAQLIDTVNYDTMYIYQINTLPLLKDRDIILYGKIEPNTGNDTLRVHLQAAPDYCQTNTSAICQSANQSSLVRVTASDGSFEVIENGDDTVTITWQQYLDPAGAVPGWLVRSQLDNLVFHTLSRLRDVAHAAKPSGF